MLDKNLIKFLIPHKTEYKKLRLGDNFDGGYVVSEMFLEKSEALFSYGVGRNISFDSHFLKLTNKPVFLFDHTPCFISSFESKMVYTKEGIGIKKENCKDFIDHYYERKISGPVLLKMDIEFNEYEYLENVNIKTLADITTGIVIEFHKINDKKMSKRLYSILERIGEFFILNHIHGNNFRSTFDYKYNNFEIKNFPKYIELTFLNKRYIVEAIPDLQTYPLKELDFPCNTKNQIDHQIDFLNVWNKIHLK